MKLNYYWIIVLLFLLYSCSTKNSTMVGTYETTNPTIIEQGFKHLTYNSRFIGNTIELNNDSTFILKSCSQIVTGKWKTKKDSLLLLCNKRSFIIDSLNYSEKYSKYTACNNTPEVYKISGKRLKQNFFINGKKIYERLKKQ